MTAPAKGPSDYQAADRFPVSAKIVFFDLETGGLDPERHPIIQIAAVAVDALTFDSLGSFESKLRFKIDAADPYALALNSYDSKEWAEKAVAPPQAMAKFSEFLTSHATRQMLSKGGKPYRVAEMAGHNVATFDMRFLWKYFKILDRFLAAYPIPFDTLQLARWWQRITGATTEDLKLGTLAKHFGYDQRNNAHDALADVCANIHVARGMMTALAGEWPTRCDHPEAGA